MSQTVRTALFEPEYWQQAHQVDAALREEAPVHRATAPSGLPVWVIMRYHPAQAALEDDRRLRKDSARLTEIIKQQFLTRGKPAELSMLYGPTMLMADAPDHSRLRKLLARDFTARRVEQLGARIEAITDGLLDATPPGVEVDIIDQLALAMPLLVICELLGIPMHDRAQFGRWASALMRDQPEVTIPASQELTGFLADLIGLRRQKPSDDLLSAMVTAQSSQVERLTTEELLATVFLLLVAGFETTVNLLGNAIAALLKHDLWQRVAARPELVGAALEETARWDSPVRSATHRWTAVDVRVEDFTIPAGEIVHVGLASANRDPRRFGETATVFNLDREDNRHLAFGYGRHFCLGAQMARLQSRIALTKLLARFPRARLAIPFEELRRKPSVIMNGYETLPVLLG
ncbi:cytochrome P450 [Kutzneria viridogrisea]|uniref:Cytochrome P450 n=1 Tax=Kutzneria viridogrisea TaxID=47990 RepID=A0ABR6BS71_9PSEU|nr:cytochrome P450 [Kutzneria viridogrisea]